MDTGAILCIVNLDEDCILVPSNFCRKCFQSKHKCFIFGEYTVSKESFQNYKGLVRAVRVICICNTKGENEILETKDEGYWGLHWIICRQVLRRRNKRLSSYFEYDEIDSWKYEYFDKYIKGTNEVKCSYVELETATKRR